MPRVECPAGPVAGSLGRGRVWRHDAPGERRKNADGSLVSCRGSLEILDLPMPAHQLTLGEAVDEHDQTHAELITALF